MVVMVAKAEVAMVKLKAAAETVAGTVMAERIVLRPLVEMEAVMVIVRMNAVEVVVGMMLARSNMAAVAARVVAIVELTRSSVRATV